MPMLLALMLAASLNCADQDALRQAWAPAVQAFTAHDLAAAQDRADAMIAACPSPQHSGPPRVMRAAIAFDAQDYDGALRALEPLPRPGASSLGSMASFIALRSWAGKKDADGFARERQALTAGVEARLTDPKGAIRAKVVDRFVVGETEVTAIEGDYATGAFTRHTTFLLQPRGPFETPRTVMLTTSPAGALAGGGKVYFLDEYSCSRHVTLEIIPGKKPGYRALRAKVEDLLSDQRKGGVSATEAGGQICAFSNYLAPGAGD